MFRLLLLFIGTCASISGQVTHLTLFEGLTTYPATSAYVRNPGNRSHMLNVVLAGQSCSAPQDLDVSMEASFDNVSYTQFGPRITSIGHPSLSTVVMAVGAFPYIRVKVRSFNTSACRLSAYYSATTGPLISLEVTNTPSNGVIVIVSNKTTGNTTKYNIYTDSGDVFSLFVSGPTNSPVYEVGTLDGNPFFRQLGTTNSSGNLVFEEVVTTPGTYDTEIVVGPGVGNVRLNREVGPSS